MARTTIFVVNADEYTLEGAPTIDPNDYVGSSVGDFFTADSDANYRSFWGDYYELPAVRRGATALSPVILTEDIDYDANAIDFDTEATIFDQNDGIFTEDAILNADVEEVGEIENLAIYPGGEVRYGILEKDGFLNIFGGEEIAVPWDLMVWDAVDEEFRVAVSEDTLDAAPDLGTIDIVDFTDRNTINDLDTYWVTYLPADNQNNADLNNNQNIVPATGGADIEVLNVQGNQQVFIEGHGLPSGTRYAIIIARSRPDRRQRVSGWHLHHCRKHQPGAPALEHPGAADER